MTAFDDDGIVVGIHQMNDDDVEDLEGDDDEGGEDNEEENDDINDSERNMEYPQKAENIKRPQEKMKGQDQDEDEEDEENDDETTGIV